MTGELLRQCFPWCGLGFGLGLSLSLGSGFGSRVFSPLELLTFRVPYFEPLPFPSGFKVLRVGYYSGWQLML